MAMHDSLSNKDDDDIALFVDEKAPAPSRPLDAAFPALEASVLTIEPLNPARKGTKGCQILIIIRSKKPLRCHTLHNSYIPPLPS
jgi:hypothetical protein